MAGEGNLGTHVERAVTYHQTVKLVKVDVAVVEEEEVEKGDETGEVEEEGTTVMIVTVVKKALVRIRRKSLISKMKRHCTI